jgi:plastocyanin
MKSHMKKLVSRPGALLAVVAIAVLLVVPAACGSAGTTAVASGTAVATGTPVSGAPPVYIDLVAKDTGFDKDTITVPAGSEVYINLDNQDEGRSYNFSVYTAADAQVKLFVGDPIEGPAQITYRFPAGKFPGTYYFRCDSYPISMHGDFVVTASEAGGG